MLEQPGAQRYDGKGMIVPMWYFDLLAKAYFGGKRIDMKEALVDMGDAGHIAVERELMGCMLICYYSEGPTHAEAFGAPDDEDTDTGGDDIPKNPVQQGPGPLTNVPLGSKGSRWKPQGLAARDAGVPEPDMNEEQPDGAGTDQAD